jgi:hypothetical protein
LESWSSIKGRGWLGKTVSPRPTELKAWAYKDFKIEDLFSAQTGDTDLQQKDINGRGTLFINSGVEALGIKGKTDREAKVFDSNTITIDFWGNAYYRDFEYKMATHNHVFSLSGDVIKNRNIGLYLVSTMSYMRKLFSYNNMGTWSKIKEQYIHLPVTKKGNIDFVYMESRIREMEESRIREMEAYLKAAGFEDCELSVEENNALNRMNMETVKFRTFYVTDDKKKKRTNGVFNVKNSHNILQSSIVAGSGNIPYVTAGEGNNSISAYISYDMEQIEKGNAIMIGGKTMVITYQENDFFSNDSHNLVLYAKDDNLRHELIQLFMVASLNKSLKPIYSWGDSISKAKIVKDKFDLPITPSGEIDYKFMETYIRAQEKLAIQKVKDWRNKEIATTKNIVNNDSKIVPLNTIYSTNTYTDDIDFIPMMVAEDIYIPGSLEIRLRNTKRDDLLAGILDLVLMYAIGPAARKKTESSGKIALGIKEDHLSPEAIKAFESVKYIMFHYWKNSEAKPFELTKSIRLVSKSEIPDNYLPRQEKDAKQYLLIEYDSRHPVNIGDFDILKAQRKGSDRYIPFVCKVDNIKDKNDD